MLYCIHACVGVVSYYAAERERNFYRWVQGRYVKKLFGTAVNNACPSCVLRIASVQYNLVDTKKLFVRRFSTLHQSSIVACSRVKRWPWQRKWGSVISRRRSLRRKYVGAAIKTRITVTFHWCSFVTCSVFEKPKGIFMHSSDQIKHGRTFVTCVTELPRTYRTQLPFSLMYF
jgi:hypothetical protein